MKKTFSMLLAVIMAAIAVCTFSVVGFADENDDPVDSFVTEATTKAPATTVAATEPATTPATTVAATEAPTVSLPVEIPSVSVPKAEDVVDGIMGLLTTKSAEDISKENEAEDIVTRAEGETVIDEGDETVAPTNAPATTKKPAKVDSAIPGTGSSVIAPAIALLALAAGTVAVVKAKKED